MSKRFFATALTFALAVVAPMAIAQDKASTDQAGPKLTVTEPMKDFGTVPKGQVLDWSFEIRNTGSKDLEVISAKPACGCTVADFDKVIKPGQKGKVTAHVDTTNFSGPIAKQVTLETNDPTTPSAQVTITAVVKPYVDAYPAGYVRYNMLQGETDKQTVTIFSEEEQPFEITKIDVPQEWIKVDYKKAEGNDLVPKVGRAGQNQYKFDITVGGPDVKVGPLAEKVKIHTNSKYQPEISLSLTGIVRPPYRVEPQTVNFGEVAPTDTAATRTVVIRSNDLKAPENFVVSKAESGVPGVIATVTPTDRKGEYNVTLQVAKDTKPGILDGNVLVTTNDKAKSIVTIPVRGTVKAADAQATTSTGSSK